MALEPTDKRSERDRSVIWLVRCDCGNTTEASTSDLTQGRKLSCGCMVSKGEQKVSDILKEAGLSFTTQQKFPTCLLSEHKNSFAKFDFYVNNEYLIEYNGVQHYKYNSSGWDTKEKFELTQQRDQKKIQWCKDNNMPLIIIPYTHFDKLCLEDLLLETTTFRMV